MADYILQYGNVVPKDSINLARIYPPPLTPNENAIVIDVIGKHPLNIFNYYKDTKVSTFTYESTAASLPYFESIHAPIGVVKPIEDETGAWHLLIRDGTFKVLTEYTSSEVASSWITSAANEEGWLDGHRIVLTYSIPEVLAQPYLTTEVDTDITAAGMRGFPAVDEYATYIDEHTISVANKNLYKITSIKINGEEKVSEIPGTTGITPLTVNLHPEVGAIDFDRGTIPLTNSIATNNLVQVSYEYSARCLVYRGYYDELLNRFCDLDLNPSYGHTYDGGKPSKNLLASAIYVFLLPSAAYSYTDSLTGTVKVKTALKYTDQLLRWEAGPTLTLPSSGFGTYADSTTQGLKTLNTYGRAYYDITYFSNTVTTDSPIIVLEDGTLATDLLAGGVGSLTNYPSALILAKIYISPSTWRWSKRKRRYNLLLPIWRSNK